MCAFQLCGKWKYNREQELVASATSTGAHRLWLNARQAITLRVRLQPWQARGPATVFVNMSLIFYYYTYAVFLKLGIAAFKRQIDTWKKGLDISTEMIGNFKDKILMLSVVDNVHGIGHVPSVDNIDYLRIHGSVSLIYCAYAFFTDVRILARQPQLDCGCNHAVCVPFNFVECGRTTESKNWLPQQPPQSNRKRTDAYCSWQTGIKRFCCPMAATAQLSYRFNADQLAMSHQVLKIKR
nr:hypothetical protein [Tanacetum cinerariifolium]